MAHRVRAEVVISDAGHFMVSRVVLDPILVAAEFIAGMPDRRVFFGLVGQIVQAPAREFAQALKMRS